jgi:NADPH-dependent glutamate synthase beta subunit-like oxidoreductase
MNIPGEDAPGVLSGIDFLRKVSLGEKVEVGKRVAVIGGGSVAIDTACTALRMGAKEVFIVYRRTRGEMPASDEEIEEAEQEKIKILYLTTPIRIVTENGSVKGVECLHMKLADYDTSGRRRPIPVSGSEFILEVETVIPAIGYISDLSCLSEKDGFKITKQGTLSVDPITKATHLPGVFAAGDMVTGPSTIVEAMASAYQAAVSIERYLKGQDLYKDRSYRPLKRADVPRWEEAEEGEKVKPRAKMPALTPIRRIFTFEEVNLGFNEETAVREAKRCLRCDLEKKEEG